MEDKDLGISLDECLKILDDNVDLLSKIEYEINQQKEDELIPEMQLTDLIDMSHDVADSSRLKKAEISLIQRHLEK